MGPPPGTQARLSNFTWRRGPGELEPLPRVAESATQYGNGRETKGIFISILLDPDYS